MEDSKFGVGVYEEQFQNKKPARAVDATLPTYESLLIAARCELLDQQRCLVYC